MTIVKVVYSIKMQNKSKQFKTIKNRQNMRTSGSLIHNYTQWNVDFGSSNTNNLWTSTTWMAHDHGRGRWGTDGLGHLKSSKQKTILKIYSDEDWKLLQGGQK